MVHQPQLLLQHVRRLVDPADDAELLERFLRQRDEDAFAALVARHGPMVLRLCRRQLADAQAAEDAFQATFLVLARKAATVRPRARLAAWLYGVACRVAWKARRQWRHRHELLAEPPDRQPDPLAQVSTRELLYIVDEEVARLPERYRLPVLLCCLEGKTQEEAARQLGWTPGSVKGRLERGRQRLHARLTRRGVVPAALLAAVEAVRAAAPLPVALTRRTAAAGVLSLAQAAQRFAWLKRVLLALVLVGAAAGALAVSTSGERPPAAAPPTGAAKEKPQAEEPLPAGVVQRLGTARLRHAEAYVAAFAGDDTVISAGADGLLRFWDVATGRQKRQLPGPVLKAFSDRPSCSPDGTLLAVVQPERPNVRLWDLRKGKELGVLPVNNWASGDALPFAPDGRSCAVGQLDTLHFYDPATGREQGTPLCHAHGIIYHAAFAPDGKVVATRIMGGDVHLWDRATGKELRHFRADGYWLTFAPDGRTLALAEPERVTLWDPATGAARGEFALPTPERSYTDKSCLVFSPDGALLAAGGDRRPVVLWDVAARKERCRLPTRAVALAFAPGGQTLATSDGSALRLWDPRTGRELHANAGHTGEVNVFAVASDGRMLASASSQDGTIRLWDLATGRQEHVLKGHEGNIETLQFSPDGRILYSGGWLTTVHRWDVTTGKPLPVLASLGLRTSENGWIRAVQPAADGKTLTAIVQEINSPKASLFTWDLATGAVLRQRAMTDCQVYLCLSPDGQSIALQHGSVRVVVEDVPSGKVSPRLRQEESSIPLAFAPDSRTLALTSFPRSGKAEEIRVVVWSLAEKREIVSLKTGTVAFAVFTPDGRYLATAGPDLLRLWEVASGREVRRYERPVAFQGTGGRSFISALVFTADGRRLVTGLRDSTVLLWSLDRESGPGSPR